MKVSPSILSADFGRLRDEVQEVIRLGAEWIHVDVMDGRFVPNLTIGPLVVEAVRRAVDDCPLPDGGRAVVDTHLMIVEPERYLELSDNQSNLQLCYQELRDLLAMPNGSSASDGVIRGILRQF